MHVHYIILSDCPILLFISSTLFLLSDFFFVIWKNIDSCNFRIRMPCILNRAKMFQYLLMEESIAFEKNLNLNHWTYHFLVFLLMLPTLEMIYNKPYVRCFFFFFLFISFGNEITVFYTFYNLFSQISWLTSPSLHFLTVWQCLGETLLVHDKQYSPSWKGMNIKMLS